MVLRLRVISDSEAETLEHSNAPALPLYRGFCVLEVAKQPTAEGAQWSRVEITDVHLLDALDEET